MMGRIRKIFRTTIFILSFYLLYSIVKVLTFYFKLTGAKSRILQPRFDLLYLEVFPRKGAGYNYRVKKWEEKFTSLGKKVDSKLLIKDHIEFFNLVDRPDHYKFIIKTGFIRLRQILSSRKYKTIIVRRSIVLYNTYGDHFFEKLLFQMHPRIILDFDDDIAASTPSEKEMSFFQKLLKDDPNYFNNSFQYYHAFITGSNYLKEQLRSRSPKTTIDQICVIPTCVDYMKYPEKVYSYPMSTIKFGWIGGNHNIPLLRNIIPDLEKVNEIFPIELIVISGYEKVPLEANFKIHSVKYDLDTEVEELLKMDVGLMPLEDDAVSRGKCGFKLIQYMGLGIPGIASAITVNNQIIDDDINGWLVHSKTEWFDKLLLVINQRDRLESIGANARKKINEHYSFDANLIKYLSFIE